MASKPKSNENLGSAKVAKKDEFYTQLTDIEKELRYYTRHFAGKTVLCNCDDPFESNFFKYFVLNFSRLGLKKLIATCYTGSPIAGKQLSIFDVIEETPEEASNKPYKAIVTTVYDKTGDGSIDMLDVAALFRSGENELSELNGDGDFRSKECLDLLDEADIVVTNPPFSLFREYISVLVSHNKKFIIIGNVNAVKYRETFPLIMNNELWLGASIHSGDRAFFVPDDYPLDASSCGIDEATGRKFIRVKGVRWFTNLDIRQRHEDLILVKRYKPSDYRRFSNYDAIIVDSVADIPCDYADVMGVPITFLDKYNPNQFDIIGRTGNIEWATTECSFFTPPSQEEQERFKKQNRTWRVQNGYYVTDDGIAHTVYDRLFIRNKHPEQPKEASSSAN